MINIKKKQEGFTLVELMLVMAIMAVMLMMRMQGEQREIEQLQSRNLGSNELATYHNAVQAFLSSNSGSIDTDEITGTYEGVNWLKSEDECSGGESNRSYLPCRFLNGTNGQTTFGRMDFETEITYDDETGFEARTVMGEFSLGGGGDSDNNSSGILGLAAMVANASINMSGDAAASAPGTNSSIVYCPDIDPMPSSMAECGDERDRIVMFANVRGANDIWLRVDHGNVMQNVIEMITQGGDDEESPMPSDESAIRDIDNSTMRQIRNVARIYNLGSSSENDQTDNLFLGSHYAYEQGGEIDDGSGGTAPGWQWIDDVVNIDRGVVVDADQQILRDLFVYENIIVQQGDIVVEEGDIVSEKGDIEATDGDLRAGRDLDVGRDASVNGWVNVGSRSSAGLSDGDVQADDMYADRYYDVDDQSYYVDPSSRSRMESIQTDEVTSDGSHLNISADGNINMDANRVNMNNVNRLNSNGLDVSSFNIRNMAGTNYSLEDMLPPYTFIGSVLMRSLTSTHLGALLSDSNCTSGRLRAYAIPQSTELWTGDDSVLQTSGTPDTRFSMGIGTHRVFMSGSRLYYRYYNEITPSGTSDLSDTAVSVIQLYCDRTY